MNICFISPCDLATDNGGRTHTIELARNWLNFGHKVFLFSRGWKREKTLKDLRYIRVPYLPVRGFYGLSFSLSSLILIILYYLRSKFDVIYERKTLLSLSLLASRPLGIPLVMELNDIPFSMGIDRIRRQETKAWRRLLLKAISPIFRLDTRLTARLSTKIITTARLDLPGIDKDKIVTITFGANTTLFKPQDKRECRQLLNYPESGRIICFVGSFLPWQGIEYIVAAMPMVIRQIPDARLLVVGDMEPKMPASRELKTELLNMVSAAKLNSQVTFVGRVPYEQVPLYVNASDLCVVTQTKSRSGYSPLKLFEYLACGKPVVASNIDGVRELIAESEAGVLVPPEDAERLAEAIIDLFQNEDGLQKMGDKGLRCVLEKYSWASTARKAMEVCEKAIASHPEAV